MPSRIPYDKAAPRKNPWPRLIFPIVDTPFGEPHPRGPIDGVTRPRD